MPSGGATAGAGDAAGGGVEPGGFAWAVAAGAAAGLDVRLLMMGYAGRTADVYGARPGEPGLAVVYGTPSMPSLAESTPSGAARQPRGLTLFVDADDTLWENNIYFEAVVAAYVEVVGRHGCAPDEARARLLDVERERVGRFGYGIPNFQASLDRPAGGWPPRKGSTPSGFAALCSGVRRRAGAHLDEVAATLRTLAGRHRVVLLTKGDGDDQLGKVARSGLRRHLHQVDVVPEKDVPAYRDVVRRHGVDPARTWMIGNSPKSDILPALGVGLGAVFIPHAATWTLELTELPPPHTARYLVLERFRDLAGVF